MRTGEVRQEAATLLQEYLAQEAESGWFARSINCTREELETFARELGLDTGALAGTMDPIFARPRLSFEETQRLAFFSKTNLYPYRYLERRHGLVEIGVASGTEEAPQRIRLAGDAAANELAQAILRSIPKPDRP
jgi:hypothetical protein